MTADPDSNPGPADTPPPVSGSLPAQDPEAMTSHGRSRFFRLTAVVVTLAILFALLELALRLVGSGYPSAFLLAYSQHGRKMLVQNNQFGWRFFGPQLSSLPAPLCIPQPKPPGTVRIFVFGESAACGDPVPAFGLSRMLEALLGRRYPGIQFEVENTAMTGINSHVILPIARDCAGAGGDYWVVYMGNNEVVGPFGAGTVLGLQAPPLPIERASVWFKATRTGELLDVLVRQLGRSHARLRQWGGTDMLFGEQVPGDDPRLSRVYDQFDRNLSDLLDIGKRHGAGIVLSTVAVNLRSCPPLASAHRAGLSKTDRAAWERLYQLGFQFQDAGSNAAALELFEEAGEIDGTFADLRFREGQCALALGDVPMARTHFAAARDEDTLRFRCDSRLNNLIRRSVAGREADRVRLADAERAFAEQSPSGVPGNEFFYEHVHLTFEGNYLLARTIAEQLEKMFPASLLEHKAAAADWPSREDCARRLAWSDWSKAEALRQMLARLTQPPFAGPWAAEARTERLETALEKLAPALEPAGALQAMNLCEQALSRARDDAYLCSQLAFLKSSAGDLAGAEQCAARQTDLLPSDAAAWVQLGMIHLQQKKLKEAYAEFQRAIQLNPRDPLAIHEQATAAFLLGRADEAVGEYRRVLRIQPDFTRTWITLGQIYERAGHRAEADNLYRKAVAQNSDVTLSAILGALCQSRGWHEAAATNYDQALTLDPINARLRIAAGKNLADLRRYPEAADQFREAARLEPDVSEPRLCLGLVLAQSGHNAEALDQFEYILKREPANGVALENARKLKAKLNGAPFR